MLLHAAQLAWPRNWRRVFMVKNAGWFGKKSALVSGMSLAEIKDAVRRLSAEERRELAHALLAHALLAREAPEAPHQAASFAEAKAYVFDNYGELLRGLGQDKPPRVAQPTDADVPAAMDAVFEKHREVLRRLAQS